MRSAKEPSQEITEVVSGLAQLFNGGGDILQDFVHYNALQGLGGVLNMQTMNSLPYLHYAH
jgi:hypothetical protein